MYQATPLQTLVMLQFMLQLQFITLLYSIQPQFTNPLRSTIQLQCITLLLFIKLPHHTINQFMTLHQNTSMSTQFKMTIPESILANKKPVMAIQLMENIR